MWQRLLRALTALLNMYSFYSNPVKYIFSLIMIMVVPYLVYIFWGSLVIILLIALGIYLLYRGYKKSTKSNVYT